LEKALRSMASEAQFKIKWLPFFLDPKLPNEGVDKIERYKQKFGSRNVEPIIARMKQVGSTEGINFSYGGQIANTLNSHRLVEWAYKFGKQDEVVSALFRSYFEEEKNLGSLEVLLAAAKNAGLDEAKANDYLSSNEDRDEIKSMAMSVMEEYGVSGVPFYIFNDKYAFSGAQEPEAFISVFKKILST